MASVSKREWTYKGEKRTAWVVRYKDQNGKKRLKTFEQKKIADAFRLRVATELATGEVVAAGDETFGEASRLFFEYCEARVTAKDNLRPSTLKHWLCNNKNHVAPRLAGRKLNALSVRELQQWIDGLAYDQKKPRNRPTLVVSAMLVGSILAHAEKRGSCRNPLKSDKLEIPGRHPAPIAIPTKEQIRRLLEAADQKAWPSNPAKWLKPLLCAATFSGLRQGELRALTWDNVDLKIGTIKVRFAADDVGRLGEPKTINGFRDVPIAAPLMAVLRDWRRENPFARLVFTASRGPRKAAGMLMPPAIDGSWCRLQRRVLGDAIAGGKFHFHALRHVAASLFIEAGLSPKRIQSIMGHGSITMTFDRYGHLFDNPELVRDAMSKIGADLVA